MILVLGLEGRAQSTLTKQTLEYGPASVFSHNDYLQPVPFYGAYLSQVGFVEADVFLQQNKLMVAHTKEEVTANSLLEDMYVRPLQTCIRKNKGRVYADSSKVLTWMIDIKSEAGPALSALVAMLKKYPELAQCKTLRITVSGNMPAPDKWNQYPGYIKFDGRPGIKYSSDQLLRVPLISDSFSNYAKWDGRGSIGTDDLKKIEAVRDAVHEAGKPLRLWGTPDGSNAWSQFMSLDVDIINTDHPQDAVKFVTRFKNDNFRSAAKQSVYRPRNTFGESELPRNVILLIADGTGLAQIYSGYTANYGALNVFNMGTVGLSITNSSNAYITDSAAGATAFSTGRKTNNRYIGVDSAGVALPTIAEQLKKRNFHTAIASCGDITDATPASFYAHQRDRGMSEEIAADFIKSNIDILIGGGIKSFTTRSDNQNLFDVLKRKGFSVSDKIASLDTIHTTRFVVVDDAAGLSMSNGRGDFLTRAFGTAKAMCLKSKQPFFMMFEGAQVDWGGHDNELPYVVTEFLDFDTLVGEAVKFADENKETLVVVTADHETGGLSLVGGSIAGGTVRSNFSTGGHTAIPVPVFAFGPGAHLFTGVYNNTEIYYKLQQLLK